MHGNVNMDMITARSVLITVTGLVLIVHLVFAAPNCQALAKLTIQVLPEVEEHRDKSFLGVGKGEVLPDYEVVVRGSDANAWNLGFKKDTSAKQPLGSPVADPIPVRYLQTIVVQDKDEFETDVLDTTPLKSTRFKTDRFEYPTDISLTFKAFVRYFSTHRWEWRYQRKS